eukprot:jgi/Ulvmu1/4636/UM002_0367.1
MGACAGTRQLKLSPSKCLRPVSRSVLKQSERPARLSTRQVKQTARLVPPRAGPPGAFDIEIKGETRQAMFNNISGAYDDLNEQLSLGQHKVWKKMAVQWSRAELGGRALDICCGSGDLALLLARTVGYSGSVVGLDFAQNMLDCAQQRQSSIGTATPAGRCNVEWVLGDAMALPYPNCEFDAVTMGYGLRNVADVPQTLQEIYRVLKPGSWAAILDFNHAENAVADAVQGFLLEQVVVPMARERGLAAEYEYIRPSIEAFPIGSEQEQLAISAGFDRATHFELGFGMMGCLVLQKGG